MISYVSQIAQRIVPRSARTLDGKGSTYHANAISARRPSELRRFTKLAYCDVCDLDWQLSLRGKLIDFDKQRWNLRDRFYDVMRARFS